MAKVLLDIPDKYIDWAGWARETLGEHGMKPSIVEEVDSSGPSPYSKANEPEDPWSAPASGARGATTTSRSTEPAAKSVQPASPPTGAYEYTEDGKTHKFNVDGAPLCEHDRPAVLVVGKGKSGKPWKQWRCALSSTARWKDKCDFSEWA